MDLQLSEKVIIVTGGTKGIGEGIARQLAAEGAIPVVVGRSEGYGPAIVRDLEAKGQRAYSIRKELGTPDSCREVIEEVVREFGRIDGLVNNAGANDGVSLENGDPQSYLDSLQKNLHHYFYLAHYALPELKKTRGAILNISSKTALTGQGGTTAYAGAKGAQLAWTREWAVELLKYGIRVNAIVPAEVMTPLYRRWIDSFDDPDAKLASIEKNIPLEGRMTTTQEIADTAVFLLSSRSSHTTGQLIFVDGGYVHLDRSLSVLN